jgi:hypothetical protein
MATSWPIELWRVLSYHTEIVYYLRFDYVSACDLWQTGTSDYVQLCGEFNYVCL